MDISVSQLNNRLALQLPAELPLGLVFVTGRVRHLTDSRLSAEYGRDPNSVFDLVQQEHALRCQLRLNNGEEIFLEDGDQVRLGGHLAFDAQHAQYLLLARDVEIIEDAAGMVADLDVESDDFVREKEALVSALAGIKRRSDVAQQAPGNLPLWVQKLAPEEVQESLSIGESVTEEPLPGGEESRPLSPEMVLYLSEVMDSDEVVELTPEILAQWRPEDEAPTQKGTVTDTAVTENEAQALELKTWVNDLADVDEEPATAVKPYDPVTDVPPPTTRPPTRKSSGRGTDWLVVVAVVVLIVLALVLIVAIYGQIIQ